MPAMKPFKPGIHRSTIPAGIYKLLAHIEKEVTYYLFQMRQMMPVAFVLSTTNEVTMTSRQTISIYQAQVTMKKKMSIM
jgi:hypothetical protein